MCLIVDPYAIPEESDTDIIVYKVLLEGDDGILYSLFRLVPYVLGDTTSTELQDSPYIIEDDDYEDEARLSGLIYLGIHSFGSLEEVRAFVSVLTDKKIRRGKEVVIVECMVPRGSKYYRGVWFYDIDYDSIVSDSLKMVRVVE